MNVQNPPSLQPYYSAMFSCGGFPRLVFLLPNKNSQAKKNHRDHVIDLLDYRNAPMMTQGFSYRYGNGNSISMIVKGSLDHFYHLEHCSFKPANGYNAARQYGHFYNEDDFIMGHSSVTKAPILRCINTVAITLNCDSNITHQAGMLQ